MRRHDRLAGHVDVIIRHISRTICIITQHVSVLHLRGLRSYDLEGIYLNYMQLNQDLNTSYERQTAFCIEHNRLTGHV